MICPVILVFLTVYLQVLCHFVLELLTVIPDAVYYERKNYNIKDVGSQCVWLQTCISSYFLPIQIVKFSNNREFSGVIVINENNKKPSTSTLLLQASA